MIAHKGLQKNHQIDGKKLQYKICSSEEEVEGVVQVEEEWKSGSHQRNVHLPRDLSRSL